MKYYLEYQAALSTWIDLYPRGKSFDSFEEAQAELKRTNRTDHLYRIRCGEKSEGWVSNTPGATASPPVLPAATTHVPSANPKQAYGDKKLPVHLVPSALVLTAAPNMGDGAEKYGAFNWRKSKVEAMTYVGAIQRHLAAYIDGEDVDPESKRGATHLGAIAACVAILSDAKMNDQLVDNRPPRGKAGDHIRAAAGVVLPVKEETK